MNFTSAVKNGTAICLFLGLAAIPAPSKAEMLQLINGDHYSGTIISMTPTNIEFRSDIQGLVKIPRDKVAGIALQPVATPAAAKVPNKSVTVQQVAPNAPAVTAQATPSLPGISNTAPVTDVTKELNKLGGIDQKTVEQLQKQLMGNSDPEVTKHFNETVNGLMSGKISVNDIRSQAKTAIGQIQAAKKDLGGDAGELLDGYIGILEKFVSETETAPPADQPKPAPKP